MDICYFVFLLFRINPIVCKSQETASSQIPIAIRPRSYDVLGRVFCGYRYRLGLLGRPHNSQAFPNAPPNPRWTPVGLDRISSGKTTLSRSNHYHCPTCCQLHVANGAGD